MLSISFGIMMKKFIVKSIIINFHVFPEIWQYLLQKLSKQHFTYADTNSCDHNYRPVDIVSVFVVYIGKQLLEWSLQVLAHNYH